MSILSRVRLKGLLIGALATALAGCTTIDPYTGQQRIDYGATAGLAGLALGATALAVAASKDDDDRRDVVVINRRPVYGGGVYRPYRPYRPVDYRRRAYRAKRYRG